MTICVAIKVHDCIVFAADSASTVSKNQQVLNVYNNADKVFNLHREKPLVAMTAGMGSIGGRSISSLTKELRIEIKEKIDILNYGVDEIVGFAAAFFETAYNAPDNANARNDNDYFEFWIGGYGSANKHGEIWKIILSLGKFQYEQISKESDSLGIFWGGQGEAIGRLLYGVDPDFIQVMMNGGADEEDAVKMYNVACKGLMTHLLCPSMPVIDVIRLAEYLVDTTKGYSSFKADWNTVGGETDLATVTKYEGFKWIKRKHFYPRGLNRGYSNHV